MLIARYIETKYASLGKGFRTVTRRECEILGIPYPLEKGWFDRLGDREISPAMTMELGKLLHAQDVMRQKLAHSPLGRKKRNLLIAQTGSGRFAMAGMETLLGIG